MNKGREAHRPVMKTNATKVTIFSRRLSMRANGELGSGGSDKAIFDA